MNYLLDTNVISELRKSPRAADQAVRFWVAQQSTSRLFLSVITIMELEIGIARAMRQDQSKGARLRNWLDFEVTPAFEDRILPIDLLTARKCAEFHVPDPAPERDALIAATAAIHGFTVVTRNTKDFARAGIATINPWQSVGGN